MSGTELAANAPGHVSDLFSHRVVKTDHKESKIVDQKGPWLFSLNLFPADCENPDRRRALTGLPRGQVGFMAFHDLDGVAYRLEPVNHVWNPGREYWIFQVPPEICADHNDIWNPNMANLMCAIAGHRFFPQKRLPSQ